MIKRFKDYDQTKAYGNYETLPKGGYVMQIKEAKVIPNKSGNGEHLEISADIYEGDYNGYFLKDWQNQQAEDKKWRGKFYVNIPADDGSEQDAWTKRRFKTFTEAVEDSNEGYHFDWDETKFKGKLVGGLFNEREWEAQDGQIRKTTNWGGVTAVENIRSGDYTLPKDRLIDRGYNQPPAPATDSNGFMSIPDGIDEEMPFK